MSEQQLSAVEAEIVAALQRDETRIGDVWRGTQAGKSPELIAAELGTETYSLVLKYLQFAQALVTGDLPTAPRVSRECLSAILGFQGRHSDSLSDVARAALAGRIQCLKDLLVSMVSQERAKERAWRDVNAESRRGYKMMRRRHKRKTIFKNGPSYSPIDYDKFAHLLTQETRPWRWSELFLTTRCRLLESDTAKPFFKARIWFGFWKPLFIMYVPSQIVSFFQDPAPSYPFEFWNSYKFVYVGEIAIFFAYFVYHQSSFVSRRQHLRDTLDFPLKSKKTRKRELALHERLSEEWKKYLVAQYEESQKRLEEAAKRREETKKRTSRPSLSHRARMPKHADDFEEVCAEWMRAAGYTGAARTAKGPDGGADVISNRAVAQAKMYSAKKVTAEEVRALVGTRQQYRKALALFFVYGLGYTEDAVEAARRTGVQLFALDVSTQKFKRITPPLDEGDADDEDLDDEDLDDEYLDDDYLDDEFAESEDEDDDSRRTGS